MFFLNKYRPKRFRRVGGLSSDQEDPDKIERAASVASAASLSPRGKTLSSILREAGFEAGETFLQIIWNSDCFRKYQTLPSIKSSPKKDVKNKRHSRSNSRCIYS